MDYKKHYDLLIEKARNRNLSQETYIEKHHIIPKCMDGFNDKSNLVKLTAREHYIVHWLLHKIYPKHKGLIFALKIIMTGKRKKYLKLTSREYEKVKILVSEAMSGEKHPMFGKKGKDHPATGRKHTPEELKKMSEAQKGDKNYMFGKKGKDNPNTGRILTEEHKKKISEAQKGDKNYMFGRKGKDNPNTGRKNTPESIEKMRKTSPDNKQIKINGILYISISDASRELNMKLSTIRYRLKSKNFPNYKYI